MKKRILFVAYGGGHINMVIPVVRQLSQHSEFDIRILGLTTASQVLNKEKIPHFGFKDIVKSGDEKALQQGVELAKTLKNSAVSYEESVAYLGLSYSDLEKRTSPEEAARLYAEKGRAAFLPLSIMERLLTDLKPDVVIATSSPRAERAAIITASKLKIPTVCLLDSFNFNDEWLWATGYGTKVCVLCGPVKDYLITVGRQTDEVIITGNPAFDRLANPQLTQNAEKLRYERGWGDDYVILLATELEPPHANPINKFSDAIQQLLVITKKHKKLRLVIRPHPNETVSYEQLPSSAEWSTQEDDLAILLKAVDVVITKISTVGLEAMQLGKPVMSLYCPILTPRLPYAKMGMAYPVASLENLESSLLEVKRGTWRPEVAFSKIGNAANNVAEVIISFL